MPLLAEWNVIKACFVKERRLFLSYRFTLLLNGVAIFFAVANYYLLGETVAFKNGLAERGYFEFILLGIAISTLLLTCMSSLMQQLAQEMQLGTIEMLLLSRVAAWRLLIYNALWPILQAALLAAGYLIVATILFSLPLSINALPTVLFLLALSLPSFFGIGLLAAAVTLLVKRAGPLLWVLNSSLLFLGGVYFPITVLPHGLQKIAAFLPMQHAVHAMRETLLARQSSTVWQNDMGGLLLMAVCWLALGMMAWQAAWNYVRRYGSLLAH